MFHEVLAILRGCPGSIFVPADTESGFQVLRGLNFLHPAEEVLLDRLCLLGIQFKTVQEFAKTYLSSKPTGCVNSLYIQAFASGLNDVLTPYENALLQMELEILKDPCVSLTYFLQLEQYTPLFKHLIDVIKCIENEKVHDCKILQLVYSACNCGIPMVETSMQGVFKNCHKVLMRQMRHWIMFGKLNDPFQEFFISKLPKKSDAGSCSESPCTVYEEYGLLPNLIPLYLPVEVAEKILFIGQSMLILEPEKEVSLCKRNPDSVFNKNEMEYTQKLIDISNCDKFSLFQFASIVSEIRTCVAEEMWKVIVEESNLISHLHDVKDFYLLGNGEFFLNFVEKANKFMKMPLNALTQQDAKLAFVTSSPDNDGTSDRFHVILQEKKDSHGPDLVHLTQNKLETGWATIGLLYEAPTYLDTIFTPSLIDRYNHLFRFLLQVRRIQIELTQCFVLQKSNKELRSNPSLFQFWQLRSHMAFFINNLQYYLQVDIIECQFQELIEKVKTIKDFEAIQHAHNDFLASLTSQCFLNLKSVYFCLLDIMELASSFCVLLMKVQSTPGETEISHYANFRLNFQRQTSLLFRVLSGIRSQKDSPHLAQLMLRMNFNNYVTSSGGHLGGPQAETKFA